MPAAPTSLQLLTRLPWPCPTADAAFVASFSIPGDDKVYFFFEETADEFDFFERLLVPRVARVCKVGAGTMTEDDDGGQ